MVDTVWSSVAGSNQTAANERNFCGRRIERERVGNCSFPVEKKENRGFPVVRSPSRQQCTQTRH